LTHAGYFMLGINEMKCYYHHEVDAVGLCKSCSKGICPECAFDVGGGLA
jgi:hypothetical protein